MEDEVQKRINDLREVKAKARLGGGQEKIDKVHARGKYTARERIEKFLDPGSFIESGLLYGHLTGEPGDGLLSGYGTVNGRGVFVYAQDTTVRGGSIGGIHGYRMYKTIERALDMRVPFVGFHDSPGARVPKREELEKGATALGTSFSEKNGGSVFYPNTQASGFIPQISAILGSCAGISVYSPALTDFIFMVDKQSHMFITGPLLVQSIMGEVVTPEELGGAFIHCTKSGVAHFRVSTEDECFAQIRELLSFLPANCTEEPPRVVTGDDPERLDESLADVIPADPRIGYDMHEVIRRIVDNGHFLEVSAEFAPEMIVGFGRLDGYTVGFVANNPSYLAGSLTVDSSDKQARFIRFCDCFNIPVVLLVDTPAYMPGTWQEHAGIIRHGAKVLYALCEATVPRISVLVRKAYGGGNLGMGLIPGMGTDLVYCWPNVEVGVVGVEQSVALFYGDLIAQAENPEEFRKNLINQYKERYANPIYNASYDWHLEDIIEPRETRRTLIKGLKLLRTKKRINPYPKKHGNIPL